MAGVDLLGSSAGLDLAQTAGGTDLLADPNAPGSFAKGVRSGVAGVKSALAGTVALAGQVSGIEALKKYGLEKTAQYQEEAAATAMRAEDVAGLGDAAEFVKYGAGYLVPNIITSIGAGLVGRAGGALAAKGLANPAKALLAKNAGMTAGLAASSIAQGAGTIYPEAVEAGMPDAAARAIVGGTIAGSLDLVPELLAAKLLGLYGKRQLNPAKGLTEVLKGAAGGAAGGAALEGVTEGAQTAVERAFAGQPVSGAEANSDYLNSVLLGVIGGGVVGAPVGALSRMGSTPPPLAVPSEPAARPPEEAPAPPAPAPAPQPPALPPLAEPEPLPTPLPPVIDPGLFGAFPIDSLNDPATLQKTGRVFTETEQQLRGLVAQRAELDARISALDAEEALPAAKRRAKQEIAKERKALKDTAAAYDQREANLKTLLETPDYVPKSSSGEPVVVGTPAETPARDATVVTPQEDELLRVAEREAQAAARVGNFKGASADTQLALLKRQQGLLLSSAEAKAARDYERTAAPVSTPAVGSKPRTAPFPPAPEPAPIKTITDYQPKSRLPAPVVIGEAPVTAENAEATLVLAVLKREQGLLLSPAEAKVLRDSEPQAAAPEVATPVGGQPRVTVKSPDARTKRENFGNAYFRGVDDIIGGLVQSGAMKDSTAKSIAGMLKRGVEAALQQESAEKASEVFNTAFDKALRGKLPKQDQETFRADLTARVAAALPVESTVAPETPLRVLNPIDRPRATTVAQQITLFSKAAGIPSAVPRPFSLPVAIAEARTAGRSAVVDPRSNTIINLGHPPFDAAQAYNAANDMAPLTEIGYVEVDADRMGRVAAAYEQLKPVNDTPPVRAAYQALVRETEQQFEVASRAVTIEPWTQEGQPYANSAEMRKDVFENNHIWVFQGGEPHPFMTPEQNWKFRAVHDLFGHAKTGFEFGARGETNATRAHAQMHSNTAIPALVTETIGQNSWVNFTPANVSLPAAERPYAVQKADLLPESLWRPILAEPMEQRAAIADRQNAIAGTRGAAVLDYLEFIVGTPRNLEIRLANQANGATGSITFAKAKTLIELSVNAKDIMSLGAHEGYHYLEQRVLPKADRLAVSKAFAYGTPLFNKLVDRARAYDRQNGTRLEDEILAIPHEARAYGFEFWRRGELETTGVVQRVFEAIGKIVEKIKNFVTGNGFTSYEDVFRAIEIGSYARREADSLSVTAEDNSYLESIEPDAVAGSSTLLRKGASSAKGRPAWIKSPADLRKLRGIMRALMKEGDEAKDWYRRSSGAILRWAGGDTAKAAKMAALVAMYSPRTPVGQDLRHALQHFMQAEAGRPIDAGGTKHQRDYGSKILDGTGYRDYSDKYVLPGNPDSAPKINSFFKNMMLQIDPVTYPLESQDATIDMWMSHIFGFGDKDGTLTAANYWWADAEIKKLARESGLAPDQAQAAIWVAVKARGNAVRAAARKEGIKNGWFKIEAVNPRSDLLSPPVGGKAKYTLKKDQESNYMVNWIRLALSIPFQKADFDAANYSYAEAFRDIADGTVPLNRLDFDFEFQAGMFDDIARGKYTNGALTFYSRAASLSEMAQRVDAGELHRTQLNDAWVDAISQPDVPADLRDKFLRTAGTEFAGVTGAVKRGLTYLQSGHNISRHSQGFKNVFNVLTVYSQRKNRLIADAVERQLSHWVSGDRADKEAASAALLERTEKAYAAGSSEFHALRSRLTAEQRTMFDQATSMIANRLDAEFKADAETYRRLIADDEQYAEWYADRAAQVERLKAEGYFPERRYGDHVVHAYTTGADGRRITAYYSQHEREADARAELAELQRVVGDQGLTFEYGYRYKADYDGSLSFAQFLDLANRQGIALTQAEKERVGKALIAADSTRRNRVFRRKDIAGYSQDGMRVLAEFGVTMANKVAYAELGEAVNDALAGKEVQAGFTPSGEVEINTYDRNLWDADGEQGGFYRNQANETVDFVMSPREGSKVSRGLRLAASAHFLGGSAAAAMINMTSLPMNTIPWLTQYTSYTDAAAKTFAAARLATKHLAAIKDLPTLLNQSVAMEGIDEVDGLRRALQIAAQDGTILDTEIYQIMGLSRGQEYSMSGTVQKAVRAWMLPFRLAEQFNRVSTFIAAYNIAKQSGLDNDAAYKQAQGTVHSTQFRYDEANRPALARGDWGSLLFTFKTYPIFMLETMTHLAKVNPQSAVYMMLTLTLMAGVEGLPFAEDIEDLVDTIAQRIFGSPFNTKRALRNVLKTASEAVVGADLSSVLMHGLANELTGLSFASRVGLGNLVPGSRIGAADADYKRVLSDLLGPVGSLLQSGLGGADSLTRGNFVKAAKQAAPLAAQNLIKGWEQWGNGFATDMGGRKLVDVGGFEAFMQGLGFSSAAVNKAYALDKIDKQTSAFYNQVKMDLTKDIVKAVRSGNEGRIAEAVNFIEAWNSLHPDMPLGLSPSAIKRQVQLAGMPLNQRTFKLLPKQLRQSAESAIGLED